MGYSNFALDGVRLKNPIEFEMEKYTLTQSTRVANGDMTMDFVANKRKFILSYSAITTQDMKRLEYLLWDNLANTKQCFHTFEFCEDGHVKVATVYSGSITKSLHRGIGNNWVWKNVKISLVEK